MRTDEEYRAILTLWEQGHSKLRIAHMTGVPRGTVRDCITRYQTITGLETIRLSQPRGCESLRILQGMQTDKPEVFQAYAFLFGLYLGDGYINKGPRTYRLRIFLDTHYPNIIKNCIASIEALLTTNKVNTVKRRSNCLEVTCYSNFWPDFFPQHGPGEKHTRPIVLENWQRTIVEQYPILLIKGLIHSDGARSQNIVKNKNYPRYEFCNHSADIKRIFCEISDQLGLHWTTSSNGKVIQIARRADVAFLDQHIGPKS